MATAKQPTRPPEEVAEEAIRCKFQSVAWVNSPLRKMKAALKLFTIDVYKVDEDERERRYASCVEASDIREMIFVRDERAKVDPYAAWDYVTCTLSRAEMLRVADWLEPSKKKIRTLDDQ